MSAPIILNTKKKPVKNIEIDGHGYKVRELGAGEMLRLGQVQRKMNKLKDIDMEKMDDNQQSQMFDALAVMIDTIKGAFDDGKDGVETNKLIDRLDPEDLGLLLEQVFAVKAVNGSNET